MSGWALRPQFWQRLARLLTVVSLLLWGWVWWPRLWSHLLSPVQSVVVEVDRTGGEGLDWAAWAEELAHLVRGQPLWWADLYRIRERLLQEPAVAEVVVERLWPDRLQVSVRGRQAVLRWYHPEKEVWYWLDGQGRPFRTRRDPADAEEVVAIAAAERHLFDAVALLKAVLPELPQSLGLARLDYSPLGGVTLFLKPAVTLRLGQVASSAVAAQKVQWFARQWPRLVQSAGQPPLAVDLRHERAFAVALPAPSPAEVQQARGRSLKR